VCGGGQLGYVREQHGGTSEWKEEVGGCRLRQLAMDALGRGVAAVDLAKTKAMMSSSPPDPTQDISSSEALIDGSEVHGAPGRGEDMLESLSISLSLDRSTHMLVNLFLLEEVF
jgi:hypothetical protein